MITQSDYNIILDTIMGFATHYEHLLGDVEWKIAIHTPSGKELENEKIDFSIEFVNGSKIAVHSFIPERKNGLPDKYGALLFYIPLENPKLLSKFYMPAAFFDQWQLIKHWSIKQYFGKMNLPNFEKAKELSDNWTKMMEYDPLPLK